MQPIVFHIFHGHRKGRRKRKRGRGREENRIRSNRERNEEKEIDSKWWGEMRSCNEQIESERESNERQYYSVTCSMACSSRELLSLSCPIHLVHVPHTYRKERKKDEGGENLKRRQKTPSGIGVVWHRYQRGRGLCIMKRWEARRMERVRERDEKGKRRREGNPIRSLQSLEKKPS